MLLYLDACCLNRPFDDQSQLRVRLETEAIRTIVQLCQDGVHSWIGSDLLRMELEQTPDPDRRQLTLDLLSCAGVIVEATESDQVRAVQLAATGVHGLDAVHLAIAERMQCDRFLTTDDRLARSSERPTVPPLNVRVVNPLAWIQEQAA